MLKFDSNVQYVGTLLAGSLVYVGMTTVSLPSSLCSANAIGLFSTASITVTCTQPMLGRYVFLQRTATGTSIAACEVIVTGTLYIDSGMNAMIFQTFIYFKLYTIRDCHN